MKRIQRKRIKGWCKPENSIYVGRLPSGKIGKYGNPFRVKEYGREKAISLYREWLTNKLSEDPHYLDELKGKDLLCWCSLDKPCHADVLLEFLEKA